MYNKSEFYILIEREKQLEKGGFQRWRKQRK
ncbi:hypothetical protein X929_06290 [Petrotoga olearia DSM 13574]|uniref:Uncharacterized protein n=1 Tax=Petrotoga olearia DSM 13574 TaxID=1122955 RepID=A0A2K1P073_9BACT|nr:MAG: hypothetical protein XD53_0583 [Petrotoga mobilis]PNR96181.1 hypothetical protein X929_06290 [Petrotoga olearia DSM 13574]